MGMADDRGDAAGHVRYQPGDPEQAEHNDDHLHESGQRYRPHAAIQCIDQHNRSADDDALGLRDTAVGEYAEDQPECRDLGCDPAQIGQRDGDGDHNLDEAVVFVAIEVADGEEIHAIERAGEEQAEQNQTERSAEGI